MVKVSQLINSKGNPAANQFVIKVQDCVYLQSYNCVVARWDKTNRCLSLGKDAFYSKTTAKHLKIFINEYTDYFFETTTDIKKAIKEGTISQLSNANFNDDTWQA